MSSATVARRSRFGAAFRQRSGSSTSPRRSGRKRPSSNCRRNRQEHAAGQGARAFPITMPTAPIGRGTGSNSASTPARISTRRATGSAARIIADGTTDTIPGEEFVAPVNVIDRSKEAAENADYLLTVESIQAWETEHGAIPPARWVLLRTDWYKRNGSSETFLNADANGPHSPGPTRGGDHLSDLQGRDRLGLRDGRHRRRLGRRHEPAVPRAHAHASGQPLRAREPLPSRPVAAQGRGADRGAAEVRRRHRIAGARAGARSRLKPTRNGERRLHHRRQRHQRRSSPRRCWARRAARFWCSSAGPHRRLPAHRGNHRARLLPRRDGDDAGAVSHLARLSARSGRIWRRAASRSRTATADRRVAAGRLACAVLARTARATSRPSRRCARGRRRGASPARWTGWAPTRPSCSRCSAARSGRGAMAMIVAREAWQARSARARSPGSARRCDRARLSRNDLPVRAIHALWAPWGCIAASIRKAPIPAQMVKVIAFAIEVAGCPIAVGGARNAARARSSD